MQYGLNTVYPLMWIIWNLKISNDDVIEKNFEFYQGASRPCLISEIFLNGPLWFQRGYLGKRRRSVDSTFACFHRRLYRSSSSSRLSKVYPLDRPEGNTRSEFFEGPLAQHMPLELLAHHSKIKFYYIYLNIIFEISHHWIAMLNILLLISARKYELFLICNF